MNVTPDHHELGKLWLGGIEVRYLRRLRSHMDEDKRCGHTGLGSCIMRVSRNPTRVIVWITIVLRRKAAFWPEPYIQSRIDCGQMGCKSRWSCVRKNATQKNRNRDVGLYNNFETAPEDYRLRGLREQMKNLTRRERSTIRASPYCM